MLESISIEDIQKVTTSAAESVIDLHGSMDKNAIDGAAVNAMRKALNNITMVGTVIIGEGQKDNAPMLKSGEKVGNGSGFEVDIAVDPIDGTSLTANGMNGAISVIALAPRGTMFDPAGVFYMDKIVTGPSAAHVIDIKASVAQNIQAVAKAKGLNPF